MEIMSDWNVAVIIKGGRAMPCQVENKFLHDQSCRMVQEPLDRSLLRRAWIEERGGLPEPGIWFQFRLSWGRKRLPMVVWVNLEDLDMEGDDLVLHFPNGPVRIEQAMIPHPGPGGFPEFLPGYDIYLDGKIIQADARWSVPSELEQLAQDYGLPVELVR